MADLLEPKEITVTTLNGMERTYTISKFPAVAGRSIVANYSLSSLPKVGDYAANEVTMLQLMCYVGVTIEKTGTLLLLKSADLINNHVPDWETLAKIEFEMIRYNTSFFDKGKVLSFFKGTVQPYLLSALPTWTRSLAQLLQAAKQNIPS
jgi:hypothetical protein